MLLPFVEMAPRQPELTQRPSQLESLFDCAALFRPAQGGSEIAVLSLQSLQPHGLIRSA